MVKDDFKEENKEYFIPEYNSFEEESYNFKKESYRFNNEHNKGFTEDNKNGSEDNISKKPSDPQHKKFEHIQKGTSTATTAVRTSIIAASSVAIVVGGVMVFNELVLPPSHVEIIEAYAYENMIGFDVFAANFDYKDESSYKEEEFGQECDIEIELYGAGEKYSFHMGELGFFYGEFTDLKYDTEYELCVYQNIVMGLERPLLASTKIRTEPEKEFAIDRPSISEPVFGKYTMMEYEEISLEFTFEVNDPDNYYSDYSFYLYEYGKDEVIAEAYIEKDEETGMKYYGNTVLTDIVINDYLYKISALSTYPDDVTGSGPSKVVILEGNIDLSTVTELNEDGEGDDNPPSEPSEFYSAIFTKELNGNGATSAVYNLGVTLYYSDPNKYWEYFTIEIYNLDGEQIFAGSLEAVPETMEIIDSIDFDYVDGTHRILIQCESSDPNLEGLDSNLITLYDEEVDFDSL